MYEGKTVLVGMPMGQSSAPPHIVHVAERYDRPQIINGNTVQLRWDGYKSNQQYTERSELGFALRAQHMLQLFIIEIEEE